MLEFHNGQARSTKQVNYSWTCTNQTTSWLMHSWNLFCHNPSLGFTTKARACKNVGEERSPKSTSYIPGDVGECGKMNPHNPKWAPTLGVRVPMDSRTFRERSHGSKPIKLKSSLYYWKAIETKMSKMGLHDPFGYLKHKVWPK